MTPPTSWQKRFTDYLESKSITQTALADRLGVTQGAVGHWLSGRREINLSVFIKLCKASGANAQYILFGEAPSSSQIVDEIRGLLAAEPHKNANYKAFESRLEASPKPKKRRKAHKSVV